MTTFEIMKREFKTARNHYITFCLMLAGIAIAISIAALVGKVFWPVVLILSAIILIPNVFFTIILSINIVDDHLVLKTTRLFKEKATNFNIEQIELQLFYIPLKSRRRGCYSMHVTRK